MYPATAKHGSARALKITRKTRDMLKTQIHKLGPVNSDTVIEEETLNKTFNFNFNRSPVEGR